MATNVMSEIQVQSGPAIWTPPSSVMDHLGKPLPPERDFFVAPPREIGPVDWLCSDVICYPKRLLALVKTWLASGLARRFVCTLKFQGETDFATMNEFAAIPGSQLLHLHANKHELTWVKL